MKIQRPLCRGILVAAGVLMVGACVEAEDIQKEAKTQSPSFQEKKWTGTQGSYETNLEYNYVAPASSNFGADHNGRIPENYLDFRHQFMRHTLLAFLVDAGLEYQHMGFDVDDKMAYIPNQLDQAVALVGIDFRWSEKDLLHIMARPGWYSDWGGSGWDAINAPLDVGYTRVTSKRFQWVVGFNLNTWRKMPYLGGAGFRWQVNDRWKLKMYMPQPDVEYLVRPNLTLLVGADIRGDAYRVGPHFGSDRGNPGLNNALVEYQEVRVGPGFSWNIRPLIELNFMTGYMVGRSFNFFNDGPKLNGSGSPFVSIALHALLKMPGESLAIPQRNRVSIQNIFKYF